MQRNEDQRDPEIVSAGLAFQDRLVLELGGLTAVLFRTEAPHSEDTVCVYVPEEGILFLEDSTSEDFFNNASVDRAKLNKLVHMIEGTDCVYCLLSHAEPLKKEYLLTYLHGVLEDGLGAD